MNIILKLLESIIYSPPRTSSEEHLDDWGRMYGIPREDGELDEDYRKRISKSFEKPKAIASKPRSTDPDLDDRDGENVA